MTSKILCVGALWTPFSALMSSHTRQANICRVKRSKSQLAWLRAAAAIARLGGNVALWASAGIDSVGDRAVAELSAEGIDCAYIRRLEGARTAFSSILVDANGERIIVPFYDRRLASPSDPVPPIAAGTYAAVMTDVRWPWAAETALSAARDAGIPAILDADTAPVELLETLLPLATHIVASEPAAISVTGTTDLRECVRILSNRYDVFTSVTAGADGCYWAEGAGKPVSHVAGFKVDAVDTLAAGDVFHGAFAHGLVEGKGMTDIIRFANAAAAIKCARFGGRAGSQAG